MESQLNPKVHTPPAPQISPAVGDVLSEGLDVFDLQLRKDCANVPPPFLLSLNGVGPSPSPPSVCCASMFSSVATPSHGLASTMSNPQLARRMLQDVSQVLLSYIATNGEPQPECVSEEFRRQLIVQFAEEMQRGGGGRALSVAGGADGRQTIDKEVVIALKNGREGPPPPGAEAPRPHHPFAGGAAVSPRPFPAQPIWRATPPAGLGVGAVSLTATSLSRRVSGGDVIRPRPQQPRGGGRCVGHRQVMTSTRKVLRSASSAFSECSAGETGEVSSSMSRTTAGTTCAIAKHVI